ncbi:ImmA/IrrE family metallo-endopeptidase [Sphingopyxis sp. PET50]|uniref:ImmA/IrrE family metallo-endopeptidase n=1 Tax=Sphingopyxis sp. PET50 TaxID=2976533 RepID=UPI0021AE80AB|nr:ImmA/IrrE family metallo-endopeptidase [Sphingopyxis sp. PET50]
MPADYDRAKRAARDLLAKYKITKAPIDPEAIAQAEGIDVVYATFNGQIGDQVAGYSEPMNGRIVINRDLHTNRKTYTIAHELGHHMLHKDYLDDEGAYQVFPRMQSYDGTPKPPEEQEADAFAAALLVPLDLLRKYVDFASPSELSRMFLVSREVILNRMKWL